jgi:hypothetical protein
MVGLNKENVLKVAQALVPFGGIDSNPLPPTVNLSLCVTRKELPTKGRKKSLVLFPLFLF